MAATETVAESTPPRSARARGQPGRGRGRGRGGHRGGRPSRPRAAPVAHDTPPSDAPSTHAGDAPASDAPSTHADDARASAEANRRAGDARKPSRAPRAKARAPKPPKTKTPETTAAEPQAPRAPADAPPARGRGRGRAPVRGGARRAFGAKLTAAAAEAAPFEPRAAEPSDLRTRLVSELTREEYDCLICYNAVARKQAVWSCTRCYAVLHLGCARKWAERSVQQVAERNALHEDPAVRDAPAAWRCPGCQHARTEVPTAYRCWCARVANPRPHAVPHSCGAPCARGCAWHGCAAGVCHPGPCPPCAASVHVPCFCGAQARVAVRCSQLAAQLPEALAALSLDEVHAARLGAVSCGRVCGRRLACGHHTCQAPCHAGACAPCSATLDAAPCHCGRHTRTQACAARDAASCAPHVASAWSCGEPCARPFACGVHRCTRVCHVRDSGGGGGAPDGAAQDGGAPDGAAPPCPYDPARVRTCFCGRTPAAGRTRCTDAVPSCGAPCGRVRACGHACTTPCHAGACPPCDARVRQVCRCGAEKRAVACSDAGAEFLCAAPCKAQRHCGRHVCGARCCPLAYHATLSRKRAGVGAADVAAHAEALDPAGVHACPRRCGRPLACGAHVCEARCHRGACAPCLRSAFTEVACSCGRTVLEPPVPCGTRVECTYPCARPDPPCGHAKVPHACHPPETPCPPCVHLVTRRCVCGARDMPAVPCSRTRVRCGTPCRALLRCGQHRCPGACHDAPAECPPCTQPCARPRAACGHPCPHPCHAPDACPDTPCDAVVVRRCACGHVEKMEVCGATRATPAADARAPLACTPECKVAQRNARFASALGLAAAPSSDTLYDAPLFRFAAADRRAALAVQDALADLVQSPRTAVQLRALLHQRALRTGAEPTRVSVALLEFAAALARVYHLDTEPCTEQGALRIGPLTSARGADLRVRRARGARVPTPLLTEYMAANPERVKRTLAAPARATPTRPAWGAPAPPAAAQSQPQSPHHPARLNALALTGVPAALHDDPASLTPVLDAATLGGRRRWRVHRTDHALVLCDIQLEPLSAAAVASAPAPGPRAALTAPERRLAQLLDDVQAALQAAGAAAQAHLVAYDAAAHRVLRTWPGDTPRDAAGLPAAEASEAGTTEAGTSEAPEAETSEAPEAAPVAETSETPEAAPEAPPEAETAP